MRKIRAGQRRPGTIFCRTVKIELDEALKTCYDMQANLRDASVAQSVEQLIRNQQVAGSSPATSSRNPRKSKDFRGFSLLYVRFFRQQNRLTHTVTHTAKCPESGGEDVCLILSAALCFSAACSHDLRHEIAHLFGCAFLHLPCDVGVDSQCESRVEMAEHTRYGFHVHAVL